MAKCCADGLGLGAAHCCANAGAMRHSRLPLELLGIADTVLGGFTNPLQKPKSTTSTLLVGWQLHGYSTLKIIMW